MPSSCVRGTPLGRAVHRFTSVSVAFIEASLEELSVRAELGQSCLATKISAPEPNLLGGSTTGISITLTPLAANNNRHLQ